MNDPNCSGARTWRVYGILTFALLGVLLFCCCCGRYPVAFGDVVKALSNYLFGSSFALNTQAYTSVTVMRLPRILMSLLVGAALSVSGCVYQTVFNNRLVSPDLLGVADGSCVGAAAAILIGAGSAQIMLGAFVGGVAAVSLTLLLATAIHHRSTLTLVLSGIIVSALFSSVLGFIEYSVDSLEKLESITFWIMGSMSGATMRQLQMVAPPILISGALVLALRYRINIIALGKTEADMLGVHYRPMQIALVCCATILTGCSTAVCGTVSWIGLIVPHMARLIVGADSRQLLPLTAYLGALILPVIDTICRTLTVAEIPISIVSAALGATVFAVILISRKEKIRG